MQDQVFQDVLGFLKALADATRLKIVGLLSDQEYNVRELAELLDLKEPTISHHLAKLQAADLVEMRIDGTRHYYSFKPETVQRLNRSILNAEEGTILTSGVQERSWEDKVLQTFLVDNRLIKIPNSRKKRDVILNWLVTQFEVDRRYAEREVNVIIKQFHPDTATLRRELIGNKLMQREDGIYWRISSQHLDGEDHD